MSDHGYRDPDFLREPPHNLDVRPPGAGSNGFERRTWGRRQFMVPIQSTPFFPTGRETATLIDTPTFPQPIPFAVRVRFARTSFSPPTPGPISAFEDFLPNDTSYSVAFRLSLALDPLGPFTDQDIALSTIVPPVPPSVDSPIQDRWPIHDIHAAQLRLTVQCLSTPLWVEAWCAPIDDMTRPGLRGDVSDLGPGYPGANLTEIAASNVSQVILAANERRTQFLVVNESPDELLLAFAPVCTSSLYSVRIPGDGGGVTTFQYESFVPAYRGVVSALSPAEVSAGSLRITEGFI